jgi:hypothetical protein
MTTQLRAYFLSHGGGLWTHMKRHVGNMYAFFGGVVVSSYRFGDVVAATSSNSTAATSPTA